MPADILRALEMTRGPAGAFLLGCDPAVDLGILRDPSSLSAAVFHDGPRAPVDSSSPPVRLSAMRVPFVNLGPINVGLAVGKAVVSPRPDGIAYNMETRLMSMGRYAVDMRTGEMLACMSALVAGGRQTLSLVWIGPPDCESVRQRIDVLCDAQLFASGRVAESVINLERTTRVGGGKCAGLLPSGPKDMRHLVANLAHYSGSCYDFSEGQPKFREHLRVVNGLEVQSALMGAGVQCRLSGLRPGSLSVEASADLYTTAMRISERRLDVLRGGHAKPRRNFSAEWDGRSNRSPAEVVELFGEGGDGNSLIDLRMDHLRNDCQVQVNHAVVGEISTEPLFTDSDEAQGRQPIEQGQQIDYLTTEYLIAGDFPPAVSLEARAKAGGGTDPASQSASGQMDSNVPKVGDVEHRKATRRAKNILAAKRSNARRKQAYLELERSVVLSRRLIERLNTRRDELLIERSELVHAIASRSLLAT